MADGSTPLRPASADGLLAETAPNAWPALAFPTGSPRERTADGCVHVIGTAGSVLAIAALLVAAGAQGRPLLLFSDALYGGGLLAMWTCSALYNFATCPIRRERFRRLDHAAIFVMIAGTYTPFTLVEIGGPEGRLFFTLVWLVALGGAAIKLCCPRRLERLSIALYLMLGWSILPALRSVIAALPTPGLVLLVAGGLFYSVGVIFHLWDRLPYQNAIWHGFVLAGASCHFAAVLGCALYPEGPAF